MANAKVPTAKQKENYYLNKIAQNAENLVMIREYLKGIHRFLLDERNKKIDKAMIEYRRKNSLFSWWFNR